MTTKKNSTSKKTDEMQDQVSETAVNEQASVAIEEQQLETPPEQKTKKIKVTGPKLGRRRAGFSFGATPTELELSKLSTAELHAIESDPMLTVETI